MLQKIDGKNTNESTRKVKKKTLQKNVIPRMIKHI